jgi:hypothetical protein
VTATFTPSRPEVLVSLRPVIEGLAGVQDVVDLVLPVLSAELRRQGHEVNQPMQPDEAGDIRQLLKDADGVIRAADEESAAAMEGSARSDGRRVRFAEQPQEPAATAAEARSGAGKQAIRRAGTVPGTATPVSAESGPAPASERGRGGSDDYRPRSVLDAVPLAKRLGRSISAPFRRLLGRR